MMPQVIRTGRYIFIYRSMFALYFWEMAEVERSFHKSRQASKQACSDQAAGLIRRNAVGGACLWNRRRALRGRRAILSSQ